MDPQAQGNIEGKGQEENGLVATAVLYSQPKFIPGQYMQREVDQEILLLSLIHIS